MSRADTGLVQAYHQAFRKYSLSSPDDTLSRFLRFIRHIIAIQPHLKAAFFDPFYFLSIITTILPSDSSFTSQGKIAQLLSTGHISVDDLTVNLGIEEKRICDECLEIYSMFAAAGEIPFSELFQLGPTLTTPHTIAAAR